jgi:hypothetical protein
MAQALAGVYKRTSVDDQYDAFLAMQGQGWLTRKAAAGTSTSCTTPIKHWCSATDLVVVLSVAPFTLTIDADGDQMKIHISIAGLLNIMSEFQVYATRQDADLARTEGKAVHESANGKATLLTAWYIDNDKTPTTGAKDVVLHRVFDDDKIEVFYHHLLFTDDGSELHINLHARALDGSSEVKSVETFARQ